MIRFLLLLVAATSLIVLGFVIDAQSRVPVVRQEIEPDECAIFAVGRVEGATPEIELRTRLVGRVTEALVEEGGFVEPGQVLLRLEDEDYRQELALAAAELELAEAQAQRRVNGARPQEVAEAAAMCRAKAAELERARLSYERTRNLYEKRAVSREQADNERTRVLSLAAEVEAVRARLELLKAPARVDEIRMDQARIQAAKARLELARVQVERAVLRAPCRGQVLKIDVEVGELTGPDSLRPVLVMADTAATRVRAFVEELDAPRVSPGMAATVVADGLPGKELQGRIARVSPRMGPKQLWSDQPGERYDTKTREIWIELEESDALVMGLRVDVVVDPDRLVSQPGQAVPGSSGAPDEPAGHQTADSLAQTGASPREALSPLSGNRGRPGEVEP